MIIGALIILALLLFISMTAIKPFGRRIIVGVILGILLIITIILIVRNDHDHFGMQQVSQTQRYNLTSSVSSQRMSILLYQPLGTQQKEKVYLYKTSQQKKLRNTSADPAKNQVKVKHHAAKPSLQIKTTRWQYKNSWYRFWFGIANNENQLAKRQYTFKLSHNWLVLSTKQAKQLETLLKQKQTQLKQEAQQYAAAQVKAGLTKALQKDPTMSASQRQQLSQKLAQQAATAYQKQAVNQLLKQLEK
ncbi:DUF4811 domain-containing protein [Liquorilactobacillus vini]|uniref:DUF4811 domain-containing protein n=1 Tax=Liquorilactobacillus vini TaxID=238015 RepID=UPI00030D0677|nr:DUF4811 domain-containing protein [Liquorilactobacillus vini]